MMAPIQTGPVYRCWVCGRPAAGIIGFSEAMGGPTALDRYAEYIGYLDLDGFCRQARHPSRVARLGKAITPLDFPPGCSLEEKIRAIREAVEFLTSFGIREETLPDKIARIVHLVHVGALRPSDAIQDICNLAGIRLVPIPAFEPLPEVEYEMPLVR